MNATKYTHNVQRLLASSVAILFLAGAPLTLISSAANAAEEGHGSGHDSSSHVIKKGGMHGESGHSGGAGGYHGGKSIEQALSSDESDSDKRGPKYGGGRETGQPGTAGTKRGGDYGDLWVILRDPLTGAPVYTKWVDGTMQVVENPADGFVQPLDANGVPIPLNAEGEPIDPSAVVEVEFERLNMARAPNKVLDHAYEEAVSSILGSSTAVTYDSSGRLVVTIDGEQKVIDSPLENLALYAAFLKDGGLTITNSSGDVVYSTTDPQVAASLLAAASSKEGAALTSDTVMYLNDNILKVPSSVDLSTFSYDRTTTYGSVTLTDATGATLNALTVLDALNGDAYADAGVTGFAQAADDARTIIEFVHNNPIFPTNLAN
jgi:hypothetical protein